MISHSRPATAAHSLSIIQDNMQNYKQNIPLPHNPERKSYHTTKKLPLQAVFLSFS
jgi:hypothetical protein